MVLWCAAAAFAVDVGVGAEVGYDLPDPAGSYGVAPGLLVPVTVGFPGSARAGLRVALEAAGSAGTERITWSEFVNGAAVLVSDHPSGTVGAGALTVGPQVSFRDGWTPYLGASAGLALVGTWSSLAGPTEPLVDAGTPHTLQAALATDGWLGVRTGGSIRGFAELRYGSVYVSEAPVAGTGAWADARRSAFAWNPPRLAIGISFAPGGR